MNGEKDGYHGLDMDYFPRHCTASDIPREELSKIPCLITPSCLNSKALAYVTS